MSFYSALVLAVNAEFREPADDDIRALLEQLGLLGSPIHGEEMLARDVMDLFSDKEALAENPHFFRPDSVSFGTEVDIAAEDDVFTGAGYCVRLHGNGYFYPWTPEMLRERIVRNPKLLRLRQLLQERFGGRFVFPKHEEAMLREAWIDGAEGWMWFGSESG